MYIYIFYSPLPQEVQIKYIKGPCLLYKKQLYVESEKAKLIEIESRMGVSRAGMGKLGRYWPRIQISVRDK